MKKTPAQLDREVAAVVAAHVGPATAVNTGHTYDRVSRYDALSDVDGRWVGKCKKCSTAHQVSGRVQMGHTAKLHEGVVVTPDGQLYTVADLGTNPYKLHVRCGDHWCALHRVTEGTKSSKHACGARCTNSTGPNCDCRCRGANHGSGI